MLAILPFMLGGTLGSALATHLPAQKAAYVIILSYCCQGLGWWITFLVSVWTRDWLSSGEPADPFGSPPQTRCLDAQEYDVHSSADKISTWMSVSLLRVEASPV